MIRLIHSQTVSGAILVDDIDDGLPNKEVHRLGSTADPKAYKRDGYANEPKQACYIPRTKPDDATLPGYIDLQETARVVLSAGKGKISKLVTAGLITSVSLVASALETPVITNAQANTPTAGAVTITGTGLLSLSPNTSTVILTGSGAVTLTQAQILAGLGTVSATSIVVPSSLIPGAIAATGSITVVAGASLVDAQTFTLNDGVNAATVFEFDSGGGVTGAHVAVPFTGGDDLATVKAAVIAAINGVGAGLAITASSGATGVVNLVNDALGTVGNVTITETVVNAGFIVAGMTGGTGAAAALSSAQVRSNDHLSNVFVLV